MTDTNYYQSHQERPLSHEESALHTRMYMVAEAVQKGLEVIERTDPEVLYGPVNRVTQTPIVHENIIVRDPTDVTEMAQARLMSDARNELEDIHRAA